MNNKNKDNKIKIPKLSSESAERDFFNSLDLVDVYKASDFSSASFPDLKPTTRSVSIRMPVYILNRLKEQANKLNIPYQTLLKQYVAKGALN